MKRTYIITLLLSLCSLFTYAQESFFDKYADIGRRYVRIYIQGDAQPDARYENRGNLYRRDWQASWTIFRF